MFVWSLMLYELSFIEDGLSKLRYELVFSPQCYNKWSQQYSTSAFNIYVLSKEASSDYKNESLIYDSRPW